MNPHAAGRTELDGPRGLFRALLAQTPHPARIMWTAAVGIIAVFVVGLVIRTNHFDFAVVYLLNGHHYGTVGSLGNAVYRFFGPVPAIAATVVLTGIILAITRNLRIASTFASTIAATWLWPWVWST